MHPIYFLWATPRSTSTAFEWMMRQRGDLTCFHEPFGEWWYAGDGAPWPRLTPASPRKPGVTFHTVWARLKKAAAKGPVFAKDFGHYIEDYWSDDLLDRITHSFLIRDPAKVVTSVQKRWPDVHPKELGFAELRALFDEVTRRTGQHPTVIDSDDMLANPEAVIAAYCRGVGIPFIKNALKWPPGDRSAVSWYDSGSWHEKLQDSDGLKPQKPGFTDISTAPDYAQELYAQVKPHYDYLHQFRTSGQ